MAGGLAPSTSLAPSLSLAPSAGSKTTTHYPSLTKFPSLLSFPGIGLAGSWPTMQLGRLTLREAYVLAADSYSGADRLLKVTGQESMPPLSLTALAQIQDDLMSSLNKLVPVSFTVKTDRNGYYKIQDVSASLMNWAGEVTTCDWSVTLVRAGSETELDLESRMSGAQTRANNYAGTGVRWHSPALGHFSYWAGASSPSIVTRINVDGSQKVYLGIPTTVNPRWGCPAVNYGLGRVRLLDPSGFERTGSSLTLPPTLWEINNGLVKLTPAGTAGTSGQTGSIGAAGVGVLNVGCYSGGVWNPKSWDLTQNATSLGAPLAVAVLRNDYEAVALRCVWANPGGSGRTDVDLLLRRGSRFVELWAQSSVANTFKVVRPVAEAATQTSGYLAASANDAAGHRYFLGAANTFSADLVNGGGSRAASTGLDFAIGTVVGGGAAVSGDVAADLYTQYLGAAAERVQGVRR